jgi:hypothetical protein
MLAQVGGQEGERLAEAYLREGVEGKTAGRSREHIGYGLWRVWGEIGDEVVYETWAHASCFLKWAPRNGTFVSLWLAACFSDGRHDDLLLLPHGTCIIFTQALLPTTQTSSPSHREPRPYPL